MMRFGAAVILGGILGAATVACGDDDGERATDASVVESTTTSTAEPASSATEPRAAQSSTSYATLVPPALAYPHSTKVGDAPGVLSIKATPFPDWITIAGDSAWVANVADGVGRYDRITGEMTGSVATGTSICLAMDAGFDSLWLGDCAKNDLVRIDVTTGEISATVELPFTIAEESSVAAGEGGVFVMSNDYPAEIVRVDPSTNAIVATFAAPNGASALRAGEGALWVTAAAFGELARLDPNTGEVVATITTAAGARFLAIGEGSVWVMNNEASVVTRVDPATNAVVSSINVSPLPIQGGDIAVGGGSVWARVTDALVAQIDPQTNTLVARIGPGSGSGSVAADDEALWISAHDVTTVWRVPIEH